MAEVISPIILDETGRDINSTLEDIRDSITESRAIGVAYDNTNSGLHSTDVQHAIDEFIMDGFMTKDFSKTISVPRNSSYSTSGTIIDIPITVPFGYEIVSYKLEITQYTDWTEITAKGFVTDNDTMYLRAYIVNRYTSALNVLVTLKLTYKKSANLLNSDASDVSYDNSYSGLNANDVQSAIDELVGSYIIKSSFSGSVSASHTTYATQGDMIDVPITIPEGYEVFDYAIYLPNYADWCTVSVRGIVEVNNEKVFRLYVKSRYTSSVTVSVDVTIVFKKVFTLQLGGST